jgi:hypothetical protein
MERFLKKNVWAGERFVRIVLGGVLLSLVFWGPHTAWGWLGLAPLITGLFGTCPAYTMLGVRSGCGCDERHA